MTRQHEQISRPSYGSHRVQVSSYGVHLAFDADQPDILDSMLELLAPGWRASLSRPADRTYTLSQTGLTQVEQISQQSLHADSELLAVDSNLEYVLDRLETDLQIYLGDHAPDHIFVHAGVVAWRGRAIVIPGRSMSGKSTLVAAFLRAGAEYYSDEFAVYDSGGRIHPYARRLALRQPDGRPLRPRAEDLGANTGAEPLDQGAILLTEFDREAHWRPQRASHGHAVLHLMQNCLPVQRRPQTVLEVLQHSMQDVEVFKGPRGEAEELVEHVLARF